MVNRWRLESTILSGPLCYLASSTYECRVDYYECNTYRTLYKITTWDDVWSLTVL